MDVSIIIPTFNRDNLLMGTLESIAPIITQRESVEVIVVDNGSRDHTADVCRAIKERFPSIEWRYFYDDMPGLLTGRHLGARKARGEILAFLDDDVLLTPSWPEALDDAFGDPEVKLAGGSSCAQYELEPSSWLAGQWVEFESGRMCTALSLIDLGPAKKKVDPLYVFGLNFSIRRTAFEEWGGFNPDCMPKTLRRYQGDGETGVAHKARARGAVALYHPGLALKHVIPASRLTLESFEQRGFYQGVCDSYTAIRRRGSLPTVRAKSGKDLLRLVKRKLERERILCSPTAENVRRLWGHAHSAGVHFHQDEVRNDPKLLEWILKPDYFDYRLPDGWKNYVKPDR
jgi:hypothetical protein